MIDGEYFCTNCKFQTCVVCKLNSRKNISKHLAFGSYTCPDCFSSNGKCLKCKKKFIPVPNQKYCSQTCRYPHCAFKKCEVPRPRGGVYAFDKMPEWFCRLHKCAKKNLQELDWHPSIYAYVHTCRNWIVIPAKKSPIFHVFHWKTYKSIGLIPCQKWNVFLRCDEVREDTEMHEWCSELYHTRRKMRYCPCHTHVYMIYIYIYIYI